MYFRTKGKMKTIKLAADVTEEDMKKIDIVCEEEKRSRSNFVKLIILEEVNRRLENGNRR